jgi:uncharacterized membrane protein (DUF4010 family)
MEPSTFIGFLFAIALGGLIGIERELPWWGTKPGWATGFGGIRSYASIALLGAITVWIDSLSGQYLWTLFGAIVSAGIIIASYVYSSFAKEKVGVTSEYAGFITYFIGVIAMMGYYTVAVIVAILLLLLLSAKEYLARLKHRFSREELGDSLKFAVIALVILPLLPDAKYSLLDIINWFYQGGLAWTHPVLNAKFFNPYGIWFFVVVMAGVEYAGFLLSKMIGDKGGIIASGAVGGLISSTATTVAMTRKSNEHPEHANSYAVATLLASCIMFIRVIVVAAYLYIAIIQSIWIPATVMFIGIAWTTLYYYLKTKNERITVKVDEKKREYESPFQLLPALQFAGLIVLIKFISQVGVIYKDVIPLEVSSYFIGLVSGLADVDGVNYIYSTGAQSGEFTLLIAATTILIAVMSNNTVKASIAYRFWEKNYGKKVLTGFWVSIVAWLIVILLQNISNIFTGFLALL